MNEHHDPTQPIFNDVHRSLLKTNMVAGCEPIAFACLIAVVVLIPGVLRTLPSLFVAAIIAAIGFNALRALGKHDPLAIGIIMRHYEYQNEYHALPSLGAPQPRHHKWPA